MALKIDPGSFPDPLPVPATPDAGSSIVLAGGCFWCTEAVYSMLDGVLSVRPGYAGGSEATANYDDVCTGTTGHAEAIEVEFDPARIELGQILKIFFSIAHDPTQLNRQGADVGTQYRSAIFFANEAQRLIAGRYIAQIEAAHVFDEPIVTTHGYAARNPWQPYVRAVAAPKVEKLRKTHGDLLKERT
jgi:peptide-methionine (S)-S-oxide reductase